MMRLRIVFIFLFATATAMAADLTGNWAVKEDRKDGTYRTTYLNLKQEGDKITGNIRATQFYYTIASSTGTPDNFTITATMQDAQTLRKVIYEGKLQGDKLHLATRRRLDAPLMEMDAERVPEGEGALPARIPPPALHKVPYNGLAKTPPMGWNSWNKFAGRVDDATVRTIADAMVSSGMKDAGYQYINIDDTWEGGRDAQGNILTNKKFPDMKPLSDYVHSKGLKLGIYSSPGPNTCAGYEGSYAHEEQDAKTYAQWGIDYLKYDWCGARTLYTNEEMQPLYQKMGEALQKSGRAIVYSLCQYGNQDVWKWGPEVSGNLWRTTGDIRDAWDSMTKIIDLQVDLASYAGPGHWNDPDMLEIGNGHMTDAEYRAHMSMWSMLAAPLIAGNDLRDMTPAIHDILTNRDVIAIDQDTLGKQATRASKSGDMEIWNRPLANGDRAIMFFNRGASDAKATLKWSDAGVSKPTKARDLWAHSDVNIGSGDFTTDVPSHGVVLLRVSSK